MKLKSLFFGLLLTIVSVSAFSQESDCDTRDKLKNLPNNPYPNIDCFYEGLADVSDENYENVGFIDKTGKLVIPRIYSYTRPFSEGLALVSQGKRQFYIDKAGKIIIDLAQYDQAWDFKNGLARVGKDDEQGVPLTSKQGYIDKTGKVTIPLEYLEIGEFENGKALGIKYSPKTGSRFGYVNLKNEPVIPFDYTGLFGFKDGYSIAVKNCDTVLASFGKPNEYQKCRFGVIDEQNQVVIPFDYEFIEGFHEGVSRAKKNGKIGVIDIRGNVISPFNITPLKVKKEKRNYI